MKQGICFSYFMVIAKLLCVRPGRGIVHDEEFPLLIYREDVPNMPILVVRSNLSLADLSWRCTENAYLYPALRLADLQHAAVFKDGRVHQHPLPAALEAYFSRDHRVVALQCFRILSRHPCWTTSS